ncbi:unnamed protein product [Ectocarpus sp. CCAP 1310/34]|nr:unnamed protein product [Ectocarpus sp. CCAP 1310/34]
MVAGAQHARYPIGMLCCSTRIWRTRRKSSARRLRGHDASRSGGIGVPLPGGSSFRMSTSPTKLRPLQKWIGVPLPANREGTPLELKVLGKGNCFDDVEQLSKMSKSMAQATFHKFCRHFAAEIMGIFHQLGYTGACGSTDVTHIDWNMCPFTLGRSFTGKEGFPTIAYEVTVDHAGRALAVTNGFTGATNDKTIIRYDSGVNKIRTESQYTEREYKLRKANGTERTRRGCFLIVDNGYPEVSRCCFDEPSNVIGSLL